MPMRPTISWELHRPRRWIPIRWPWRREDGGAETKLLRRVMAGLSVQAYANIGALVAALAGFVVLAVSYVFWTQKSYIRSDYLVIFVIVNVCIWIGALVFYYYKSDHEIKITV
jgi:hypothetical protein